jgi:hypothetical protein
MKEYCEQIENIKNIFGLNIKELSDLFGTSHQIIFKWLSGELIPEQNKIEQIIVLDQIISLFQELDISYINNLVKMKMFGGCSMLDLSKRGGIQDEHIIKLFNESRKMEDFYERSGLAITKSKPTSDWKSNI